MRKILLPVLLVVTVSTVVLIACSKGNTAGSGDVTGGNNGQSTTLKVRLTDAPINADSVNVDIRQVRVNFRQDSTGWVDLNTNAGIYDLLGLQNGVDTLLAAGTIPSNSVQEIRLVLGGSNSIVVNGMSYPLTIPSGAESGLKLKINKQLTGPIDSILIDFDAALSIHQTGQGNYMLKPVLKIK